MRTLCLSLCVLVLACGDGSSPADTGPDAAGDAATDAGMDAGLPDSSAQDVGVDEGIDSGPADAGEDATADAAEDAAVDTGVDASGPTVPCGEETCDTTRQMCCVPTAIGTDPRHCVLLRASCDGATIRCDGPEACSGGEICCADPQTSGVILNPVNARCRTPSACAALDTDTFEACHVASDCRDAGDMCCPSSSALFTGRACRPLCTLPP